MLPAGPGLARHFLDRGNQGAFGTQGRGCLPNVKEYFNLLKAGTAVQVHPG